jgi:hypothetical protein
MKLKRIDELAQAVEHVVLFEGIDGPTQAVEHLV